MSTVASGEIDYEELEEQLAAHVDRPAIINVNIGTTVTPHHPSLSLTIPHHSRLH